MIEEQRAELIVYGVAQPQGSKSARVVKGRAILTEGFGDGPQKRKAWRQAVSDAAREWQVQNKAALFDGEIHLAIDFYFPRPKSLPKKYVAHTKKPDLSKTIRSVEDSLTGIIIRDDSYITSINASKSYSTTPRVEIRIISRKVSCENPKKRSTSSSTSKQQD